MATPENRSADDASSSSSPLEARNRPGSNKAWEWAKEMLFIVILLAVLIALGVVIFRVITTDTSLNLIPTSSESAAVIRANERVVQLTQWTISTILIVAGGLIGLNWYQNQRRYERDKEELDTFRRETSAEVASIGDSMESRLGRLERQSEALAEQHRSHVLVQAVDDVARSLSVHDAFHTIAGWYDRVREVDNERQQRALTLVWQGFELINEFLEAGDEPEFYSTGDERREFFRFLDRVEGDYPELQEFLNTFRTIPEAWEEAES